MKNDRGITLTSLMIYVIGMVVVVGIMATFTSFFYKNIDIDSINRDTTQYTKFSSIFLEEINKGSNYVVDYKQLGDDGVSYIIFASGNQYTFLSENNSVYKNKVKICADVDVCDFSVAFVDAKYEITVDFKTEVMGEQSIMYSMVN